MLKVKVKVLALGRLSLPVLFYGVPLAQNSKACMKTRVILLDKKQRKMLGVRVRLL